MINGGSARSYVKKLSKKPHESSGNSRFVTDLEYSSHSGFTQDRLDPPTVVTTS
jgi:hypothetical protein